MIPRWFAFFACAALLAVGSGAAADAKSDAVVKKARAAAAQAKTLQAQITINAGSGGQMMKVSGSVRLMKPNYAHLTMRSDPAGFMDMLVVSNGTDIFMVEQRQKQYQKTAAGAKGENLAQGPAGVPVIASFFSPETLLADEKHRYGGTKKVDGKSYEVVQVTSREGPQSQEYYFGASGLVEGIVISDTDAGRKFSLAVWLKDVQVNAPMKAEEFAYTPPADFTVARTPEASLLPVGKEAPDFRLPQPAGGQLSLAEARRGKKAVLVNFWFYG